jgi:hypothetical protein
MLETVVGAVSAEPCLLRVRQLVDGHLTDGRRGFKSRHAAYSIFTMSRSTKKPKTGGKAVSSRCQNNGGCDYCENNRKIATIKGENKSVDLLRDYLRSTPPAELVADWAVVEQLGLKGPTLSEVLGAPLGGGRMDLEAASRLLDEALAAQTPASLAAFLAAHPDPAGTHTPATDLDRLEAERDAALAALAVAEKQLMVARIGLRKIGHTPSELLRTVQEHNTGTAMWLSTATAAQNIIQDMRNLKRK